MEYFSYKGGCGIHEHAHIKPFNKELAWATNKWLWVISNTNVIKTVIPLRF